MELESILRNAKEQRVSDIHLVYDYAPIFRIDGQLVESEDYSILTKKKLEELTIELIGDTQYQIFKTVQEYDMAFEKKGIGRYRGNFHYQKETIGISLRKLNDKVPVLSELKLEKKLKRFLEFKNGLVLVTGETGSGKTTTVAALLNEINMKEQKHIITLEDPIEYIYPKGKSVVEQREIGTDTKTFGNALKYILRQDPDVIFVGELRDIETVSAAITAAETGHLVFATLHTNSASKTIDRILDVFPKEKQEQIKSQLSSTLRGIVTQQLIPKLRGTGRVLSQEILINTPAISNLIKEGDLTQINSMMEINTLKGMTTMNKSLELLYEEQIISKKEYMRRKV